MPTETPRRTARLVLEDGSIFEGPAFGADATTTGEVVFNTAMCGYQEALTDPSYRGQVLVMTPSEVGNYGVAEEDVESGAISVSGFVVRELARKHSNHRAFTDLDGWMAAEGVPGIAEVDTRALVRRLRVGGAMRGILSTDASLSDQELLARARSSEPMSGRNLAAEVTPSGPGSFTEDLGEWGMPSRPAVNSRYRVVALDCGAKHSIYRHLVDRGCEIHSLPLDVTAEEILASGADGLFVSNGPGDPAAVEGTIETLRQVAGTLPTFGICLGHQLLALALGARTWKLKFGHRGANQPVRNLLTGRVEITSQNHGFCVDAESLVAAGAEVTHIHLNDGTVAGFRHREKPIFSVQYHPEASPGPHDSAYLFDCFIRSMASGQPVGASDFSAMQEARAGVGHQA
ncbi:MAG: glutamine-hydrolyzing carbamoyl-phosphate synthase small subunit [Phycisphaerales bacterium]|nr:glutamine-hydrolyzing carbamoyl-phosphate synthase small subunit [Phycisphaerales bacterium]